MNFYEIESIVGNGTMKPSQYIPDIEIGNYIAGITVEYKDKLADFIGVHISLDPIHLQFSFSGKRMC